MKKLFLFLTVILFFSCEKNDVNNNLPKVPVNIIVNLNLPQYNKLNAAGGWVEVNGGIKGVFITNKGTGKPPIVAFDRYCPNNDCQEAMIFDNENLRLKCTCDQSEYSVLLGGAPQTPNTKQYAKAYKVVQINSYSFAITNY